MHLTILYRPIPFSPSLSRRDARNLAQRATTAADDSFKFR
jgi:hypothetical protein